MEALARCFADRRRTRLLLVAAVVAVRLQTLFIEVYNRDEACHVAHALVMLRGGVPYVDFVEKKPPLIYCFYWLAVAVFGPDLRPIHLLTIGWVLATCLVLEALVRRSLPPPHAACAALGYALFTTCYQECDALATNCEILMNLPAALSSYALLAAPGERWRRGGWMLAAGLLLGTAFLFKHQAGIGLVVAAFWLLGARRPRRQRALDLGALGLGFALLPLLVVAIYARLGFLRELYEWNVTTNLSYITATHSPRALLVIAAEMTISFVGANLWLFALAAWLAVRWPESARSGEARVLVGYHAAWLAATVLPVAMGGRFYGHYYIQMYPPLCVLAGVAAGELLERRRSLPAGVRRLFVAALVGPAAAFQIAALLRHHEQDFEGAWRLHRRVAAAVDAASAPGDRVFAWGQYPYPYYFARRDPATRYILCEYVLPFWETYLAGRDHFEAADIQAHHRRNYALLLGDLRRRPPQVIVDTSDAPRYRDKWAPFSLDHFPELQALVRSSYQLADTVEGVQILRRRVR
jgi:4-amino-4-deoxy-L-arabinose transferase-like glycosyltransferase